VSRLNPAGFAEVAGAPPVPFTDLVLTTGGSPRRLPIPGLPDGRALYLRSVHDALQLRDRLHPDRHLAVVGAGFIGGELAASARKIGAAVTMLEMLPVPLARVAGDTVGAMYADIHRQNGVSVLTGVFVESAAAVHERLLLTLSNGHTIECDDIAIGVGLVPRDELAREAGITCRNGIVVDEFCRSSALRVWAAGDVAQHQHPLFGRSMRVEHQDNAIRQGTAVAANILAANVPYADPHWFWSDQYDHKLQGVGLIGGDMHPVCRGELADRRFTMFYRDGTRLIGALSMNTGTEIRQVAKLITARAQVPAETLADPRAELKDLARAMASAR
jgi:3-phenylpropionate/trans-cinnamate dioxygenase ferredoxin reductase subunit